LPFSRGGATHLLNGRATCPNCNTLKGNKMTFLRTWQQAALDKALTYFASPNGDRHFVINAAPGAGKTRVSCVIAQQLLATGAITRVIVIASRNTVVTQWADDFSQLTGRNMMKITDPEDIGSAEADICATWAAVNGLKDMFQAICARERVLVICDEHHHAAITAAWGTSADSAFKEAAFALILTGTPLRSDGAASVWLNLDDLGAIDHPENGMYTLTYGQAVELDYCRPVTFHRHRGLFTVDLGNGTSAEVSSEAPPQLPSDTKVDSVLRRVLDFQRLAKMPQYRSDGITPRPDGYQATMIACAREKLDDIQLGMPQAAGLVIAPDIAMAEYLAKVIEASEGEKPVIVHSNIKSADRRIASFRRNHSKRWLVSVGMVTEGVDIPRLRVLVYLPAAGTELAFRQAIGRVVRNSGPNDSSRAYVVMPALQSFDTFARRIEEDLPSPGLKVRNTAAEKVCRACGGLNGLAEASCIHCEADFTPRQVCFRQCQCGAFNRMGDVRCNNCGEDVTDRFAITLTAAARDGVISRGIDVPEDEVIKAEDLAPAYRAMIARAERENQVLARVLRTVPVELMASFLRLVTDESLRDC
jgi:superfamily II DNA or RNA helicase